MFRAQPVGNKLCAQRERERLNKLHRSRLKTVRSSIDTREPGVCKLDHLKLNLKREQLLEERYSEIDRENRILLQKMSDIMRQPSFHQATSTGVVEQAGPVSLNRELRRKELERITAENQAILRRIQHAQPMYNHAQWEEEHRRNRQYLRNCVEYPLPDDDLQRYDDDDEYLQDSGADEEEPAVKRRDEVPSTSAIGSSSSSTRPADSEDQALLRHVLKEGKKIGERYYLVEMATDGRTLTISAYDGDSQQTLELLVNEKNHRKLYRECHGNYTQLASRLAVEGTRLILLPLTHAASAPAPLHRDRAPPPASSSGVGVGMREVDVQRSAASSEVGAMSSAYSDGMGGVGVDVDLDGGVHFRGFTPDTQSVVSGVSGAV